MIAIGQVLLSDEVVSEEFVCDLSQCKGGCCVDGDCGAPLTDDEAAQLESIYPQVKEHLPEPYQKIIETEGYYVWDDEYGKVTPTVNNSICAYGYTEPDGVVKCGIERAWKEGKIDFPKPISCHLFPIRITSGDGYELVNYEPRKKLCRPACKLGRKLKVPVYKFLKNALLRKYGEEFYDTLEAVAQEMARVKTGG